MLRRSALLVLFCAIAFLAVAQTTPPSPADQLTQYGQALAKNPRNVEALVGLARLYFDNSTPLRNLPTAARYAEQAEQQHAALLKEDQIKELHRLGRLGIDLGYIRQLRHAIADAALLTARVRTDMTLPEVDLYLEQFGSQPELAKLLRARRLQLVYQQTMQQGTNSDLYQFALLYAGTAEATEVEAQLARRMGATFSTMHSTTAIDSLAARFPRSTTIAQLANDRKSRLAFEEASAQGTLAAFRHYLTLYPASNESEQARQRIDQLTEQDLAHRHTATELIHFADSNADSPLADKALARLRKVIYRNHDVAAAHYYVTHYTFDPHRNELYNQYYSWYATEGNGSLLSLFAEQNPDFPYQRALEDALELGDEIDNLPLQQPYSDSLYLEYEDLTRRLMGKAIAIVPLQRMLQSPLRNRNYTAAAELAERFELVFDNAYAPHYNALLRTLRTPNNATHVQSEVAHPASLRHPCYNVADGYLYFSDGHHLLRTPRRATKKASIDTLRISGLPDSAFTLFGFFDRGRQMLLGSDGDIWIARHDDEAWRVSELPPYPVNTDYIETDAQMLPDGSGLLLASDRPGGYNLQSSRSTYHGDTALATDLYFIPRTQHGWGAPVNLGPTINSAYSERSPLLSRNLRTLYFVSDAPGGMGYGDIYVSTRQEGDNWTQWSKPRHLGREVNSPWREADLAFDEKEQRVLYSTNDGGARYQLRSFATQHSSRQGSLQHTIDLGEAASTMVSMQVADLDDQTIAQTFDLDGLDTALALTLDRGRHYALLVRATDRFVATTLLDSTATQHRLPAYTYADLVAADRQLPLPTVARIGNSDELTPMAMLQLDELARFVKLHPQCHLEIAVDHPTTDATKAYAESQRTAEAVRDYLVRCGLESTHISLSPYGNARFRRTKQQGVSVRFRE